MHLLCLLVSFFLYPLVKSDILELTDRNFYKQTNIHHNLLIFFYGSDCYDCLRLIPEIERAEDILSKDEPRLSFLGQINCTVSVEACIKNNVTSVPVLKLYKDGVFVKNYERSRLSWSLVKFLRAQVNPPSKELKSIEDFRQFRLQQRDAFLVGFFAEMSRMMRAYFKLANTMKESLVFAHSHCENLLRREKVYDGIVLFRPVRYYNPHDDERVLFTGKPVIGEMKTFLLTNYHGLVGRRTPYNIIDFSYPLVVLYYTTNLSNKIREPHYWRLRLFEVAKKYRSKVTFAVSEKDDFEPELETFGYNYRNNKPVVVGWSLDSKKYKMISDFSAENVDKFTADLLAGKLRVYVKPKQALPRNTDDIVIVAVSENFEEVVLQNDLDTLLYIYESACPDGDQFVSVYKRLAEELKSENVLIVITDASKTKLPKEFKTRFPVTFWLSRYDKDEKIIYNGVQEVDELLKFICEKATEELMGYDREGKPRKGLVKTEL